MEGSITRRLAQAIARRRVWLATLALALIAVGGVAVTRLCLSDGNRPPAVTVPLASFYPPNAVEQTFVSRCDGLARVDVWLSSPGEPRYIRVGLQTDDHKTLGIGEFLVPAREQMRCSLTFPAVRDSAGRRFRLLWQGQGLPLALEASPIDAYPEGDLFISDTPAKNDLAMALYYQPTTLRAWGCVLSGRVQAAWTPVERLLVRMSQYKPVYLKKGGLIGLGAATLVTLLLLLVGLSSGTSRKTRNVATQVLLSSALGAILLVAWLLSQDRVWPGDIVIQLALEGIPPGVGEGRRITDDLLLALGQPDTEIAALEDWYVAAQWLDVEGERPVLWMHPPSRVSFTVSVPPGGQLAFGVGVSSKAWDKAESDGVEFEVTVATATTIEQVYWRAVDPQHNPDDRHWFDEQIDLSNYAGQEVAVTLITYPRSNNSWDWAGWSLPRITGLP